MDSQTELGKITGQIGLFLAGIGIISWYMGWFASFEIFGFSLRTLLIGISILCLIAGYAPALLMYALGLYALNQIFMAVAVISQSNILMGLPILGSAALLVYAAARLSKLFSYDPMGENTRNSGGNSYQIKCTACSGQKRIRNQKGGENWCPKCDGSGTTTRYN